MLAAFTFILNPVSDLFWKQLQLSFSATLDLSNLY